MNTDVEIKADERMDDLQLDGLRIIQNPMGFCFGVDAVLLSNFVKLKKDEVAVEFGTGTGVIPILLSGRKSFKKIIAFEVQPEVADMAKRSIRLNHLEESIQIIEDNLKEARQYIDSGSIDVVFSNPPYMSTDGGIKNDHSMKAISRHEVLCNLEDIVSEASRMLKFRGRFYMIHRPHRLVDIVTLCRKYKLEPKEIRMIQPYYDKKPNIFLIMCSKGGRSDLKFHDPLIVYEKDGRYTDEIYKIYGMENITVFTDSENPKGL
ncbi:MAG TPA: SAM-dependent methyltransferase [Clostridiales bacterium UBA8960]|jgi:tRNA1Val (adenine37-N6)-methyltransferase|nr:SAM-dependent methyltransferase [Clostridiales bacterium UBA8960]